MSDKEPKVGTFRYYAKKLGIAEITAKKYGKDKCKSLLSEQGIQIAADVLASESKKSPAASKAVSRALDAVVGSQVMDIVTLDAKSRQLGSELLYDALIKLKELKDSPELSVYQRAQMNLAVARLIAGAK